MADQSQSDAVRQRYDRGTAVAAVAIAVSWHIVHNLLGTIVAWPDYDWPPVAGVAWLVYAVAAAVASRACLAGRALPGAWWWCAAALLVTVAVFATAPDPLTPANWGWGAAGWLAILLLWRRGFSELLLFLGINALASLLVLLVEVGADRVTLGRYLVVIGGSATLQLAMAGGTRALRAAAGWAAGAAAGRAETLAAGQAAEQVHRARQERYGAFQRATGALLADLAAGRADPADPVVRHACAIQAARLRRLLVERGDTADPLLDELRACGDIAERKGVVVELSTVGRVPLLPVAVRRALAEPAIAVLTTARSRARVTVSALPDEIVVGVIADTEPDPAAHPSTGDPEPSAQSPAGGSGGVMVQWHQAGGQVWMDARVPRPAAPEPAAEGTDLHSFGRTD